MVLVLIAALNNRVPQSVWWARWCMPALCDEPGFSASWDAGQGKQGQLVLQQTATLQTPRVAPERPDSVLKLAPLTGLLVRPNVLPVA